MDDILSPDGTIRVSFAENEMKMSHWVCNPIVTHIPTGDTLLDLTDTLWDAGASFEPDGRLRLELREYPGATPGFHAVIDPTTLEVQTREWGATPSDPAGSTTLESLWRSLAPSKPIPNSILARRRTLEARETADDAAKDAAERSVRQAQEQGCAAEISRSLEDARRLAELDRQAVAAKMKIEKAAAEQQVLAWAARNQRPPDPGPSPDPPPLRPAARNFMQAFAGLALTLGTLALALTAWWGLAWLLAERTPLNSLPSFVAWSISSLLAALVLIGIPIGLLMWGFRNYRG